MKRLKLILPLAAIVLSGTGVMAAEGDKSQTRPGRAEIIKQFDKNGDGVLDESERAAAREEFQRRGGQRGERSAAPPEGRRGGGMNRDDIIKKYDKNKDGQLDDSERAAAREAIMAQRGGQQRGGRPEGGGRGRGGFDREALMKEFDKDGDGQLNEAERQAAMTAMRERFQGQGRGPAGRPGGGPQMNREAMMKKFDKNGDGRLDETERAALREEFQNTGGEQRRPRPEGGKPKGSQ